MQEVLDNQLDKNSHTDEISEDTLYRLEFIEKFHSYLREMRWHGSEQFKSHLEDALGLTLSGANDEECMIFFKVILELMTSTPMDTFYATFHQQQSYALQSKSDYHKRAEKIIKYWALPIRMSLNIAFLYDHKAQCINSIEAIQDELETNRNYCDSQLKTAVSLAAIMNSHQIFGFNDFIDEIRQLDQDEKSGLVESNPNVLIHKSFRESSLIKSLVLWANSITACITITRESTPTRYAVLNLQCAKLELENTQLNGYKSVIDQMESVIIPRYKDEIRALNARKATLVAAVQKARAKLYAYQDRLEILNIDLDFWVNEFKIVSQNGESSHGEETDSPPSNTPRF